MILAIESSCDDSSLALMSEDYELLYYKKISQEQAHSEFGGVIPELASRLHTRTLPSLLEELKDVLPKIKAVAVTNAPGLSVSLITGLSVAKMLSVTLNIPLIEVNHLVGHIYSLFLDRKADFPLGILLVSGGHTMILEVDENRKLHLLAQTYDDSFGESFDKVAKMMALPYPGGIEIEKLALKGDKKRFNFTIPLLHDARAGFSFSGLKNQVRVELSKLENVSEQDKSDIAYAFQETAIAHIMNKLEKIFKVKNFKNFAAVGGASANLQLRSKLEELCEKYDSKLSLAPLEFCSDNAVMIARAGLEKYFAKDFISYENIELHPRVQLDGIKI